MDTGGEAAAKRVLAEKLPFFTKAVNFHSKSEEVMHLNPIFEPGTYFFVSRVSRFSSVFIHLIGAVFPCSCLGSWTSGFCVQEGLHPAIMRQVGKPIQAHQGEMTHTHCSIMTGYPCLHLYMLYYL